MWAAPLADGLARALAVGDNREARRILAALSVLAADDAPEAAPVSGGPVLDLAAPSEHDHKLWILMSFLAPYYVVYSSRSVDDPEKLEELSRGSTFMFINGVELPQEAVRKKLRREARRREVSLDPLGRRAAFLARDRTGDDVHVRL
jgi:hypothetical protein